VAKVLFVGVGAYLLGLLSMLYIITYELYDLHLVLAVTVVLLFGLSFLLLSLAIYAERQYLKRGKVNNPYARF